MQNHTCVQLPKWNLQFLSHLMYLKSHKKSVLAENCDTSSEHLPEALSTGRDFLSAGTGWEVWAAIQLTLKQ